MKLSKKSEYACLALIDLCENSDKEWIKIVDICNRKSIPKKFLEQILVSLKNSGYIKSKKGSEGGYRLNKEASQITIAEILRLMDGALAPVESVSKYFYENSPIEQNQKLINIFTDIRDYVSDKLEKSTFQDLI
ncbi:MAG: Rrf2 family transcriptional regulator [Bacteroidota bacterium]